MSNVYLNGEIIPHSQAKISVFDRGFLFADGIYEVVPIYNGMPFLFTAHMQRLDRSLREVGIPQTLNHADWRAIIAQLNSAEPFENSVLYIQITRGSEFPRNHLPSANLTPTVMATLSPFTPPAGAADAAKVALLEDIRWLRCDIKSISLLGNIMLKQQAHALGAVEPVLHRAGRITEGASSNYFVVRNGALYTAPNDALILPGITREHVLKLAREHDIEVHEKAFSVAELYSADECFLCSSTREIMPVGYVDEHQIGNGQVGPITQMLIDLFRQSRPNCA
jgi:D-alanine transaminase